jgi:hypothetical protein
MTRLTTTYTQWSLNSIYGRDDLNRLRRIFATLKQLTGEANAKELALKALCDAAKANAVECSNWLASFAASGRQPPNPPALHTAVEDKNALAARFLARHSLKRDIAAIADDGLRLAALADDAELVEIFRARADVNKALLDGTTPLMAATAKGSSALRALLPHSNREERDMNGRNALMRAILNRNEDAMTLLLREASEAEINAETVAGKSARELAEQVQADEQRSGRLGVSGHPFRPLDMMKPRIEFFELSKVTEVGRVSSDQAASPKGRGPRRL